MPCFDENVLGFDVAMNPSPCVEVHERLSHLSRQADGVDDRQRPFVDHRPERATLRNRHDRETPTVRQLPGIEKRHDVRVSQPPGDSHLALEADIRAFGDGIGAHNLYGDVATMSWVARAIYDRVSADAEDVDNAEPALHQRGVSLYGSEFRRLATG